MVILATTSREDAMFSFLRPLIAQVSLTYDRETNTQRVQPTGSARLDFFSFFGRDGYNVIRARDTSRPFVVYEFARKYDGWNVRTEREDFRPSKERRATEHESDVLGQLWRVHNPQNLYTF